jgi:hypothetical protein
MAVPSTRAEFTEYCLRSLGKNVIEINVSDEQVDDRIDFALRKFTDFHFEGAEKIYYKHLVTANNRATAIYDLTIDAAGTGYSNSDVLTFVGGGGTAANGTITTNSNGVITAVSFSDNGTGFATAPNVSIVTSGGSGATITAQLGGWLPLPDNVLGVINLFDVGSQAGASNLFSLRYQIVLNDLYLFNNLNIVPYAFAMYNVALIHELLVGKQPLRYNRYKNKAYIDMDWSIVVPGTYIIAEAYQVLDPDVYTKIWSDPWLQDYAATLIKEQWGENLSKFTNMPMVGGMTFNGLQIKLEAKDRRRELEAELISTYSLPAMDFVA